MIPESTYHFSAPLWLYQGQGAWHFITLPHDVAARIRTVYTRPRRGWGSIRVAVTIGTTCWKTSIFPERATQSFLLPIKAEVRRKEALEVGQEVPVALTILE